MLLHKKAVFSHRFPVNKKHPMPSCRVQMPVPYDPQLQIFKAIITKISVAVSDVFLGP
jgi:hypothetical protein